MVAARAEFRVFGRGVIDTVKARMWEAHAALQGIRRLPPEIYVLSTGSDEAIVKVRDGLLDLKVKTGHTSEGYEIFEPRGKFPFPVTREELARVLAELKVSIDLSADRYSLDALLAIARRQRELVAVTLEKTRHGFTVGDVICEYDEVWFNGALMESACCESEDPAALARVVGVLGLSGFANVNYLRAAKRVVGMT